MTWQPSPPRRGEAAATGSSRVRQGMVAGVDTEAAVIMVEAMATEAIPGTPTTSTTTRLTMESPLGPGAGMKVGTVKVHWHTDTKWLGLCFFAYSTVQPS